MEADGLGLPDKAKIYTIIQVVTSENDSQCANIGPFVVVDNTLLFQGSFREAM